MFIALIKDFVMSIFTQTLLLHIYFVEMLFLLPILDEASWYHSTL